MSSELRVGDRSETVANRILARRAIEDVFGGGTVDAIPDVFAPDAVLHLSHWGTMVKGRNALERHVNRQHEIFSECDATVESLLTDGDQVVAQCTVRGRHTGTLPIPGYGTFPATNNRFTAPVVYRFRIEDGRIVEAWRYEDALRVAEQLGLVDRSPRERLQAFGKLLKERVFQRAG
ncbi:ester cyclase [Haloarchaeobius sp. DFWS5]|uniref:ester cyclase n=1 Tax=Haloarchaeobius sp. DFWS5 TaxID=3446114 RepID=UPI003EC077F3